MGSAPLAASLRMNLSENYAAFTKTASRFAGRSVTFAFAALIIAVWLITGPLFAFSDT